MQFVVVIQTRPARSLYKQTIKKEHEVYGNNNESLGSKQRAKSKQQQQQQQTKQQNDIPAIHLE